MQGLMYYDSPVGTLLIESDGDAIVKVHFHRDAERATEVPNALIGQCIQELDEYFYKGRKFFTVNFELRGSAFQRKVWNELLSIPAGKTISYEEQSLRVGDLKSIRAVALANGQNPIVIIVPCHRVIGKSGDLTGFGGGLENKRWLLSHEGAIAKQYSLF
jgi:methylated-DNA-[protein]-cysteine S-methyltransferase